jgi:hypothetical protein
MGGKFSLSPILFTTNIILNWGLLFSKDQLALPDEWPAALATGLRHLWGGASLLSWPRCLTDSCPFFAAVLWYACSRLMIFQDFL